MSQGKLIFAGLLLVAALIGGLFFAGWLTILLIHVNVPLTWNTWWQYFRAIDLPQVAPYVPKIKAAGGIGFGAAAGLAGRADSAVQDQGPIAARRCHPG
jgi:type IV secretion system protein VirD4